MVSFSPETWGLVGAIAGIAIIAILYTLAAQARDHVAMHDLKLRVHALHREYTDRLTALRARNRALEEAERTGILEVAPTAPPTAPAPPATPPGQPERVAA